MTPRRGTDTATRFGPLLLLLFLHVVLAFAVAGVCAYPHYAMGNAKRQSAQPFFLARPASERGLVNSTDDGVTYFHSFEYGPFKDPESSLSQGVGTLRILSEIVIPPSVCLPPKAFTAFNVFFVVLGLQSLLLLLLLLLPPSWCAVLIVAAF